jgi:hypothetical protein
MLMFLSCWCHYSSRVVMMFKYLKTQRLVVVSHINAIGLLMLVLSFFSLVLVWYFLLFNRVQVGV